MNNFQIAAVILIVMDIGIGYYDQYVVQRTFADLYADRHRQIPPLIDWFFTPDADPVVEHWRRRHRNLYALGAVLAAGAVILMILGLGNRG